MPTIAAPASGTLTATAVGPAIVIARGNGSDRRVLGTGYGSLLSPDGSKVVVTDADLISNEYRNYRLELYSSAGGAPKRVFPITCADTSWSPDSARLACAEIHLTDGKAARLLLIDPQRRAMTTLARGFFTGVSFSPDSRMLAYVQHASSNYSPGTLKVIDIASRAVKVVRSGVSTPVWGPSAIAFATGDDVGVVQPDGSGYRQLTRFRPASKLVGGLGPVAWSADGKRLLGGQGGQDTWVAYAIDAVRGGSRRITPPVTPSALSSDGRFVIGDTAHGEDFGPKGVDVLRVPWAGGKPTVLLRDAKDASYVDAALQVAPLPSAPVISGRCSKAEATAVVKKLQLGESQYMPNPVYAVLCGAFMGPGSNVMVVSLASGGTSVPFEGWVVFQLTGKTWQLVMQQLNGAQISAAGTGIRETKWISRPGDPRCCPSGGKKERIWRWNGTRFVAGPWQAMP